MNLSAHSTISKEDVEDFARKMRQQRKKNSAAKAEKRLIESGILTKSGKPKWPVSKVSVAKRRIVVKKAK
jgi:hypothetical protein